MTTRFVWGFASLALLPTLVGCVDQEGMQEFEKASGASSALSEAVAALLPAPVTDADFQYEGNAPAALVDLGRNLFFDKVLSGTNDISCATCHHPFTGTADGVSLGLGHTSEGLSVLRVPLEGVKSRIVRNSPGLFNLGWKGLTTLMTDGDISLSASQASGFSTPAGSTLPNGLHDILAAQNMFPANQPREMAGHDPENPLSAAAVALDNTTVWRLYAEKVAAIPEYLAMFEAAFSDVDDASDVTFVHIANALSAFQTDAFRADNSPFDRYLRGETGALSPSQEAGLELFYGEAGCSSCHSGVFQSDLGFHAISIPQFGPGRANGVSGGDTGRARVSRKTTDAFKYKTPMLRNVSLTAPYGHDGAYATLEGIVRHHLDPVTSLNNYDTSQAVLPPSPTPTFDDFTEHKNTSSRAKRAAANELQPVSLTDEQIKQVIDFLHALTDPASLDLRHVIPNQVPSGLPVSD